MDVVGGRRGRLPDRARGHPQAPEQRLALPDDHARRGDVRREGRRRPGAPSPSAPARTRAKWNRATRSRSTRNDDYWGEHRASPRCTFKYFADPTALNNALLTGTIDVIGTVQTPESLASSRATTTYQVIEGTTNGEVLLSLNNESGPLSEHLQVRQAVRLRDRPRGAPRDLLGRPRRADRQHGAAHRPVVRGPHRRRTPTTVEQAEPLLEEAGYDGPAAASAGALAALRGRVRPGGEEPARAGRHRRSSSTSWSSPPPGWTDGLHRRRLRHVDRRHVEPRDMGAVFGDPSYYTRYDNAGVRRAARARRTQASPEEQVTLMQEAAADAVRGRRAG